jgi:hypothetical protein
MAGPEFDKSSKKLSVRCCVEGVRMGPYATLAESACPPRGTEKGTFLLAQTEQFEHDLEMPDLVNL